MSEQPRIILASASPRRIQLLHQIGLEAEVMPSHKPEVRTSDDPETVVRELSRQKAEDIADQLRKGRIPAAHDNIPSVHTGRADEKDAYSAPANLIVIGADTVVAIDGKILGKPRTHEEAYAMIHEIAGRAHHVFTGVTVCFLNITPEQSMPESGNGQESGFTGEPDSEDIRTETFVECTAVHVASMTEEEIRNYADSDEPMDKAGAYGIQGVFGRYISGIEGDYNNVVGLPAAHLYQVLKPVLHLNAFS